MALKVWVDFPIIPVVTGGGKNHLTRVAFSRVTELHNPMVITNKVVINQKAGYLLLRTSCKLTGSVDSKSTSVPVK